MAGLKIKKGDRVRVLTGKDRGKTGEVMRAMPADGKVIVDGVNIAKKHQRATSATMQGGIIDKDMPIPVANVMEVPRLEKIVINMGVGAAVGQPSLLEGAVKDLTRIAGQKPIITRARKSIANFKLREENPIGTKVTLRGARMWEFLDRLISLADEAMYEAKRAGKGCVRYAVVN